MKTAPELARAKHSLACVERVKADDNVPNEKYLSYAESLPATILMNGLGQAVASLCSAAKEKKKDPHWILYRDLEGWLLNEFDGGPYRKYSNGGLIEAITDGSPDDYQKAQIEALLWLAWLKKFARAYLAEETVSPSILGGEG